MLNAGVTLAGLFEGSVYVKDISLNTGVKSFSTTSINPLIFSTAMSLLPSFSYKKSSRPDSSISYFPTLLSIEIGVWPARSWTKFANLIFSDPGLSAVPVELNSIESESKLFKNKSAGD